MSVQNSANFVERVEWNERLGNIVLLHDHVTGMRKVLVKGIEVHNVEWANRFFGETNFKIKKDEISINVIPKQANEIEYRLMINRASSSIQYRSRKEQLKIWEINREGVDGRVVFDKANNAVWIGPNKVETDHEFGVETMIIDFKYGPESARITVGNKQLAIIQTLRIGDTNYGERQ